VEGAAVQLNINGQNLTVNAAPETPLLWLLREQLTLVGSKFGCGMGLCGACTVIVDGKATRGCITPISTLAGKSITTIEGLSADGKDPVQQAWNEVDVPQCGYCQAGQIMTAKALLDRTPDPSDEQVDAAMSNNLCRCGTYPRIRKAIHRAAELRKAAQAMLEIREEIFAVKGASNAIES
jgi:isoquinoline 1-oxidoreductase alpha subunit